MASARSTFSSSISIHSRQPSRGGAAYGDCVENIDIGGPAMIPLPLPKNSERVTVVVAAEDYGRVMEEMQRNAGATSPALRKALAAKAFGLTASYDAAIGGWLARRRDWQ